jgi:hypothetical protein
MIKRPHAVELILGAAEDPVFRADPAGRPWRRGGRGDRRQGARLPPLDPVLAEDALSRTRVDRLLRGYRDRPPAAAPSATPWCGCRSSSPTWARSPSSTSIRCWPMPTA